MKRGGVLCWTRELGVAWIRMAVAIHLVVVAPLAPVVLFAPDLLAVFLPWVVVLATPLVFFHRLIVRKEPPFLRRGYLIVAAYGPVAALPFEMMAPERDLATGVLLVLLYEVVALLVTGVYVLLWRLGDRWFGEAEHPRPARRWALAGALALTTAIYVPYALRVGARDACIDGGGRFLADGACDFGG